MHPHVDPPAAATVERLLFLARSGDAAAESRIFQQLYERFRLVASRRIAVAADADDLAQEASLTVLQKYKHVEFDKAFEAWAYGVLRNKIGNYLKAQRVRAEVVDTTRPLDQLHDLQGISTDHDHRLRLMTCLRALLRHNPRYARMLALIYQGFGAGEICARLEVTLPTYYVVLSRSRKLLRACLEQGGVTRP